MTDVGKVWGGAVGVGCGYLGCDGFSLLGFL